MEYISKHEAYTMMKDLEAAYIYPPVKEAYATAARRIDQMPAAGVQPINPWISVKDRLPDEDGWYLVCKHNRVRVAEWCKDCWYNESDLPIDDCAITYWQPLPEPPKNGDIA